MISFSILLVLVQSPYVPPDLQPWVPWVQQSEEHLNCPFRYDNDEQHYCAFYGPLTLEVNDKGGNFRFRVNCMHSVWIQLPNSEGNWPQSFRMDNRDYPLRDKNGITYVQLAKGVHDLRGTFEWDQIPHSIRLSPSIPIIFLTVNGSLIAQPNRKEPGKLWLGEHQLQQEERDRTIVQVFHYWEDQVPARLTTRIILNIAGKSRTWKFPIPQPDSFQLTRVETELPFQVEGNQLNVQLRPGDWELTLTGLSSLHLTDVEFPTQASPWPEEEILVFGSNPQIRQVEIRGLTPIDSSSLPLPPDWKNHPCYLLSSKFQIEEKLRGNHPKDSGDIYISRKMWLDESGGGLTFMDDISGHLQTASFLSLENPYVMGSVKLGNENKLIVLREEDQSGIEIRQPDFNVHVESRIKNRTTSFPSSGLNLKVKKMNGYFVLPPGWEILFSTGPIHFGQTWLSAWDLFDIFIVILLSLALSKLWTPKIGALAAFCFLLCFQEPLIPPILWIILTILSALVVFLPSGRLKGFCSRLRLITFIILAFVITVFISGHLKYAFYPHLQKSTRSLAGINYNPPASMAMPKAELNANLALEEDASPVQQAVQPLEALQLRQKAPSPKKSIVSYTQIQSIQTGFGLPEKSGNRTIAFHATNELYPGQNIHLFMISPGGHFVLIWLQSFALLFLSWKIFRIPAPKPKQMNMPAANGTAGVIFLLFFILSSHAKAQFPDSALLSELKERLHVHPECLPQCAQYQKVDVRINDQTVSIKLTIHSMEDLVVPLPGQFSDWLPDSVTAPGNRPNLFLTTEGSLWVHVPKGIEVLDLSGPCPNLASFSIPFPMSIHNLTIEAEAWGAETPGDSNSDNRFIRFFRTKQTSGEATNTDLSPYFMVKRQLKLDQKWSVRTDIRRIGKSKQSILLEIPLLKDEAVITPGYTVRDGVLLAQFPGNMNQISLESSLPISESIKLNAAVIPWLSEEWSILLSEVWNFHYSGIEPVSQFDDNQRWNPTWQPWPGEELEIFASQEQISPGKTSTIQSTYLDVSPSSGATTCSIEVKIQTSQGGIKRWTFPESAQLKTLYIDDQTVPTNVRDQTLEVPLNPGKHLVRIEWEQEQTGCWHLFRTIFRTPHIDLKEPTLNNNVTLDFPRSRWVFGTWGPSQGPVLLFWSHLLFFALASYLLSRIPWLPITFRQLFLLSLGLDQVHIAMTFFIYAWLLVIAYKGQRLTLSSSWKHNLALIGLTLSSILAAFLFLVSIKHGLINMPEMGITGNGSYFGNLAWYLERDKIPTCTVFSIPTLFYRVIMLAWALWLARWILNKAPWFWDCYRKGGFWRQSLKEIEPEKRRGHK